MSMSYEIITESEKFGRKPSWSDLNYYPNIHLDVMEDATLINQDNSSLLDSEPGNSRRATIKLIKILNCG